MALRALQGPTGGGAPVGGTGTTNTIPRWTGPSTLGDSVITQSGTFIGVGVPTPAYPLQVQTLAANTNTISLINGTGNISRLGWVQNGSTTLAFTAIDGDGRATGYMSFLTAAVERMRITDTGNVGIGTASPGNSKLNVTDASAFAFQAVNIVASGTNQDAGLRLQGSGGKAFRIQQPNISAGIFFYDETNSAERARIDSTGNFILNTANTGATIQAAGTSQGLKLPATPGNADTQTLDAYQEMGSGTYVASTATLTCGTSGTITLKTTSDQNKLYVTRIGRTVHVSGFLVVDSVASPTGRLTITTSPALPAVQNGAGANIVFTGPTGLVAGDLIQPTISASTIFCDVYNAGVQSQTGAAKMQANTSLWVSFSYHAA